MITDTQEVLVPSSEIQEKVREIAERITRTTATRNCSW